MGDVAGIGPEIIARAWPELVKFCEPVVVGDADWLGRGQRLVGSTNDIPCIKVPTADLSGLRIGEFSAAAGRAAYDFLCAPLT